MRTIFLLTVLTIFVVGCSDDVSTNTPVIQGSVDNQFFKAAVSSATLNADGSLKLTGEKDVQTITLQTSSSNEGQYTFGENPLNEATFLTFDQELYVAGNGLGDGMIEITKNTGTELWGVFYFNGIGGSGDTLNFQKGVFFGVPIVNGSTEGGTEEGDVFTAEINGTSFTAAITEATVVENMILASGAAETTTISLEFPADITAGDYQFDLSGAYTAEYTVNGVVESAESGTLHITSNDTVQKVVKGTFEFTTDVAGTLVGNGAFELTYQ